ncbi:Ig-like domain-containing protein [Hymenobacter sp. 5414T-23]|uniref:Ig-like domain-containing protein n=1 Tax=Hymenobacter sp. 5414T-23 TaxID=2932252 RepID=UPI001FD3BE65|nr:Ig-like domain-containing protein [Hymenobacter sp. 5414T-23]UOQ82155.1 Ig-like domain-containing protein [Hymenobacter sp. 5414T-23]
MGTSRFGLVRDGQWHEVVIPMSAFNNGDLGSVTATFMFAGDAPGSAADFYFDNIYYSGGVATNPAPTVSLTSPTNEALITTPANITLTANAADANGSVTKVDFYSGATLLGTSATAPYSATWSNVTAGTYTLTAKATDNEGVVTTSTPITVFVAAPNNAAPAVSITAPAASSSFTTPATLTVTANATDADGSVYKVEFYNGQTLLSTDYSSPYTYTWSGVAAGTYTLTAKATDNGKLATTSAPVSITVKSNVLAGPNFGVYTENAQVTEKLLFGQDADLYLWNNLNNIPSPTPYEGSDVLALRAGAGNWFGFGVANSIKNVAAFANGSLKFHFKTTYTGQFKVGVKSGTEGWVDFAPGATQYGLVRDGQWHEVTIPLKAFGNLDWTALEQAFMFAGDAPSAQADFYFDNIYYNTAPVTLPPVTYCATAASGDYSYAATTVGNNVNFVFHPLGSTAGGNLAIIYVNGPGYGMTKNAQGDFTYSLPNQTAGQALNFYFTYQVGAGGGEKNSAAAPHSYTVGSVCSDAPAPSAPTVSLTSPTAAATFAAPATITLTASAADTDGTISKVEFYQGTTLLSTATTAPYSYSWTGVAAGSYALTAKAFDNSGLATTSAAVAVTVTGTSTPGGDTGGYCDTAANGDFSWKAVTTGPDVAFTFHPLGTTAGGNLAILYINGGGYSMTKNSAGDFTYTARGQAAGSVLSLYFTYQVGPNGLERNTADAKVSYTVGTSCAAAPANTPPTVSLTSPTATTFAAPASITLTASATDADGSIAKVEFYQGATLLGSSTAAPYSFQWNNVPVGSYALTAKATDNGGLATTSAPVNITVAYADEDGDGYPANEDCDDHNPAVHPGLVFYADADGDGFGNSSAPTITACLTPAGYVLQAGDCNDQDASINPAAKDVCGQDRNCDGRLDLPAQAAPTIAVTPASAVYTGGNAQTIYLGYGPQSVTLTATAPDAASYSWSPATGLGATTGASTVFTPNSAGSYTLQVTARNAAGCTATAALTVTVLDIRAGKKGDKVMVCHKGKTLEISAPDAADHLKHGDNLGSCSASASLVAGTGTASAGKQADEVTLYPNPAQDHSRLEVALAQDGQYSLSIYDLKGTLVKQLSNGQGSRSQRLTYDLDARDFADGIYLVRLVTGQQVQTKRLVIQH